MKQIFINLPVTDLDKSVTFYSKLGFVNNPEFSDESAKCMAWGDGIFLMLLTHSKFKSFTTKPIADAKKYLAGIYSLTVDSLDLLNEITNNAVLAGATEPVERKDYGFMQQSTIEDYDGHNWEIVYMDWSKLSQQ